MFKDSKVVSLSAENWNNAKLAQMVLLPTEVDSDESEDENQALAIRSPSPGDDAERYLDTDRSSPSVSSLELKMCLVFLISI